MAYNGSGTFNLLFNWQNDAAASLNISSSRMQSQDADIASGLSNCVTRDGQSPALANLSMGGFRHTNVGDGLLANDYASIGQVNKAFPIGMIAMWNSSAAAIPANFQLCDGTNGTPNLKDRFIVGAGATYANGATGGAATVTLDQTMIPVHNHAVTDPGHAHVVVDPGHAHAVVDPGHQHAIAAVAGGALGGGDIALNAAGGTPTPNRMFSTTTGISISAAGTGVSISAANTGVSTQNAGSGAAHENRPPYYALCFVQRMS